MFSGIEAIVRKEFTQMLRHPRMRVMLFLPPVIQLIIFGYACNLDVETVRIAWMDGDHTPQSRDLLSAFTGSGRFLLEATPQNDDEARALLDKGDVQAIVRVLPRFGEDILRGQPTDVQLLIDGTNPNSASLISSYSTQVVSAFSARVGAAQQRTLAEARIASLGILSLRAPRLATASRVWFNPELKSRNFFIPGVLNNILLVVTVTLTAMSIVREKEIGTIEQLMVTPIRPIELIAGKMIPAACIGLVDVLLITTAAVALFQVPFEGSGFLLFVCSLLFLLTGLGTGLLISTISRTQQQAALSAFLFATPAFMFSGFVFPIRNMPQIVQYITYVNPLRYFLEIVRGIMLKGAGVNLLWPQMAMLLAYGVAIMGLSAARFRKRLD
jgi:drug efflux transport system permease protein